MTAKLGESVECTNKNGKSYDIVVSTKLISVSVFVSISTNYHRIQKMNPLPLNDVPDSIKCSFFTLTYFLSQALASYTHSSDSQFVTHQMAAAASGTMDRSETGSEKQQKPYVKHLKFRIKKKKKREITSRYHVLIARDVCNEIIFN